MPAETRFFGRCGRVTPDGCARRDVAGAGPGGAAGDGPSGRPAWSAAAVRGAVRPGWRDTVARPGPVVAGPGAPVRRGGRATARWVPVRGAMETVKKRFFTAGVSSF
ncbi:hypothetical protein GCM10018781_24370 [Kitasatospora indigofera]|uniref:Uncharacterized protein n=1 Tax=Kitasatospora indigofera TaxID=67307 RepID=A0A919KPN1_9ACTN|nr:hypothetical protein GCM10018781_24370 [Kitasatospora indigofera]